MRRVTKQKKRGIQRIVDEESQVHKLRATFINFRRKLEGELVEGEEKPPIQDSAVDQ